MRGEGDREMRTSPKRQSPLPPQLEPRVNLGDAPLTYREGVHRDMGT